MRARISKAQLEQMLAATRNGVQSDARHRLHVDQHSDPVDEAQWSEDAAVAIEELDVARRNQQEASLALKRLQDGAYGLCTDCKREISESRLQALPWATRCVRCETLREFTQRKDQDGAPRSVKDWLDATPDAA